MIDELERIWKEAVIHYSGYYSEICLEGHRKPTKNTCQVIWCPGRIRT
jgi:hypothetical protein